MSDFGIICEVNPLHNGHKYLIDSARDAGADRVVCVMSGNTVQRGEFAILDKYTRAEALLKCGADVVLELPFPWCSGSAESFSGAGIEILRHFCDTVIFGSEIGDIKILNKAADVAGSDAFREEYLSRLNDGAQAAGLYYEMIKDHTGADISSNDLLGIEYIRASKQKGARLSFKTVKRLGDPYLSEKISDARYPSATAIRSLWKDNDICSTDTSIPTEAMSVYRRAIDEGKVTDNCELDAFWLSFFRLSKEGGFEGVIGAQGGLVNRFCSMSRKATSADEMLELVKNKRYTDSHLRRVMLYCLAGVTQEDMDSLPVESLLLAANEKGRELLSEKRKEASYRIITKPADLTKTARQNILGERIEAIFALAHKNKWEADASYKMKPYIE